jgi:hypothetical protein
MPKGKDQKQTYLRSQIAQGEDFIREDYKVVYGDNVNMFEQNLNAAAEGGYKVSQAPFMNGTKLLAITSKPITKKFLYVKETGERLPPNAHIEDDSEDGEREMVARG